MARGEHIKVSRGVYYHHGIDVGNGMVVHYSGDKSEKINAVVCRVSREEFAAGGNVVVVDHGRNCRPLEETARLAESRVGMGRRAYDFWGNNCEHFARWCKTGAKESKQVQKAAVATVGGYAVRKWALGAAMGPLGVVFATALSALFLYNAMGNDKIKDGDDTPKIGE